MLSNEKETLNKLHEVELEIMDLIHEICVKYNLKYSLAYGSLIGAVRHQGFIPWDDDLDIFMPREDYEKFKKIWLQINPSEFFLQDIDVEEEFTQNFMKVRKNGTIFEQVGEENLNYHKGVFVDIFPLDKYPNKIFKQKMYFVNTAVNLLLCRKFLSGSSNKIQNFVEKFILKLPKKMKNKLRINTLQNLMKYNNYLNYDFVGTSTMSTINNRLKSSIFNNLMLVKFEDRQYYAIEDYDSVLRDGYGDYMVYPPKEEQTWKHKPIKIEVN